MTRPVISTLCCWLVCVVTAVAAPTERYTYHRRTGDAPSTPFVLTYQPEQAQVTITTASATVDESAQCLADGDTRRWQYQDPATQTRVEVYRRENRLDLSGQHKGEAISESVTLDEAPWYQFLSWSLRPFLASQDRQMAFWSLRPSNLKPYKMKVEKQGIETIQVQGRSYQAHKIQIRPTGLFASLWKGHYWFSTENHLFLRYEAVHGPPGSPVTRIELQPNTDPWLDRGTHGQW